MNNYNTTELHRLLGLRQVGVSLGRGERGESVGKSKAGGLHVHTAFKLCLSVENSTESPAIVLGACKRMRSLIRASRQSGSSWSCSMPSSVLAP